MQQNRHLQMPMITFFGRRSSDLKRCKVTGLLSASLHLTPILFISGAMQSTFKFDPVEFDPDTSIPE